MFGVICSLGVFVSLVFHYVTYASLWDVFHNLEIKQTNKKTSQGHIGKDWNPYCLPLTKPISPGLSFLGCKMGMMM